MVICILLYKQKESFFKIILSNEFTEKKYLRL